MKKVLVFSILAIAYLLSTYIVSTIFGLPPYNRGFVIGFPAIYFEYALERGHETISGYTSAAYLLINTAIIMVLYTVYSWIIKKAAFRNSL